MASQVFKPGGLGHIYSQSKRDGPHKVFRGLHPGPLLVAHSIRHSPLPQPLVVRCSAQKSYIPYCTNLALFPKWEMLPGRATFPIWDTICCTSVAVCCLIGKRFPKWETKYKIVSPQKMVWYRFQFLDIQIQHQKIQKNHHRKFCSVFIS